MPAGGTRVGFGPDALSAAPFSARTQRLRELTPTALLKQARWEVTVGFPATSSPTERKNALFCLASHSTVISGRRTVTQEEG